MHRLVGRQAAQCGHPHQAGGVQCRKQRQPKLLQTLPWSSRGPNSGQADQLDFSLMNLLHMQTCGEAGITVRPRTPGGRDAMLRTAAEAAVDAAMEQSGAQLGGMPPAAFITGLAGDLGVRFATTVSLSLHTLPLQLHFLACSVYAMCRACLTRR